MTHVTKVMGVPGAGKSTMMQTLTEEFRDDGYSLSDFRWLTFSRSHADDLAMDIDETWTGGDPKDNVSTIHSMAYNLVGVDYKQIITPLDDSEVFEEFWDGKPVDFDAKELSSKLSPDKESTGRTNTTTNIHRAESQMAESGAWTQSGVGIDADAAGLARMDVSTSFKTSRAVEIIEAWREFKSEKEVYQHHDYIIECFNETLRPDCDVLMIDEMQDLSPVQFGLILQWINGSNIDEVVVCGDGYQSIYGFKQADARYFRTLDADEVIDLRESYRCPAEVCRVARRVLPESDMTLVEGDEGPDNGSVYTAQCDSADEVAKLAEMLVDSHNNPYNTDAQIAFLARTNRQASKIEWALRENGVPHTPTDSETVWNDATESIIDGLRDTVEMDYQTRLDIVETMPGVDESSVTGDGDFLIEVDCDSIADVLDKMMIKDWRQELIAATLERNPDHEPLAIDVGTIHSYKGREAEAVVIADAYSANLRDEYRSDDEFASEEDRLAYVAATRASDTLVRLDDFFELESFRPFDGVFERLNNKQTRNTNDMVNADD